MDIIKSISHEQMKSKVPVLDVGITVRVHVRIKEGNRERVSYGVGVEKTFLVHSPLVEKIEVVRVGKARRAKLFYLRDRIGKASKTKEKLGARIETKEVVLKEEMVEEPAEPETEEPVEEEVKETENVNEVVEEATNEEAGEAPEEAPAIEEEKVVEQETVDTVKEENVEEVKEKATEEDK